MDNELREKLERAQLEQARARLTQDQRIRLESHAERLRENEAYAPKYEIALADVIYENRAGPHQRNDLDSIHARAQNETRDRALKERHAARLLEAREAEAKREATLERQRQLEIETREKQARHEALAREPIPGSVQRFNDHLGQPAATRETGAAQDRGPLTANEIHRRFGDSGLEARYRREQQERNPRDYSELSRPLTAADYAARANTPGEKVIEPPATREKFTREARGEKHTREVRDGQSTRATRDREEGGGRDRDRDGRSR